MPLSTNALVALGIFVYLNNYNDLFTVKYFGAPHLTLPKTEQARTIRVRFTLTSAHERALAHNTLDLLVLPASARQATYQGQIAVLMRRIVGEIIGIDVPEESPEATDVSASSVGVSHEMTPEMSWGQSRAMSYHQWQGLPSLD